MAKVHRDFLAAGADVIESDSFGSSPLVLAEYDLADRAYEISRKASKPKSFSLKSDRQSCLRKFKCYILQNV